MQQKSKPAAAIICNCHVVKRFPSTTGTKSTRLAHTIRRSVIAPVRDHRPDQGHPPCSIKKTEPPWWRTRLKSRAQGHNLIPNSPKSIHSWGLTVAFSVEGDPHRLDELMECSPSAVPLQVHRVASRPASQVPCSTIRCIAVFPLRGTPDCVGPRSATTICILSYSPELVRFNRFWYYTFFSPRGQRLPEMMRAKISFLISATRLNANPSRGSHRGTVSS